MVNGIAPRTGIIIQARLGSTRLPGKVLLPLPCSSSTPLLEQIVKRARRALRVDIVVVATSDRTEDDAIAGIFRTSGTPCFRGSEDDVLSRFFHAAREHALSTVVRLTGDNPCIDPRIVDSAVEHHLAGGYDYTVTKGYPTGMNIEVLSFRALKQAQEKASAQDEREHVTPYLTRHPEVFSLSTITAPRELTRPDIRVTLDTEEDYALQCAVYDLLYPANELFGLHELLALFEAKSWLKNINKRVVQKDLFPTFDDELREAIRICGLQDLPKVKAFLEAHGHEGRDHH